MTCEWCGGEHAREALCAGRPKWTRRGFLTLFGAGVAGLAIGGPEVVRQIKVMGRIRLTREAYADMIGVDVTALDAIYKQYYASMIALQLTRPTSLLIDIEAGNRDRRNRRRDRV